MSLIIVHILLHHKLWSNTVDWLCGPERIAGNWSGITVSGKLTVGGARLVAIEAAPGQSIGRDCDAFLEIFRAPDRQLLEEACARRAAKDASRARMNSQVIGVRLAIAASTCSCMKAGTISGGNAKTSGKVLDSATSASVPA
jgi:hypothetical protein